MFILKNYDKDVFYIKAELNDDFTNPRLVTTKVRENASKFPDLRLALGVCERIKKKFNQKFMIVAENISEENEIFYKNLDKSLFNEKQLHQIEIGLQKNLDISIYAKPELSHAQMFEYRCCLQYEIEKDIILEMQKIDLDNEQIREIRTGLTKGIDYTIYLMKEISAKQMYLIKKDLLDELDYKEKDA